ncbi:Ubiquitin-conjugating enzyme E2 G1 [Heterocephalus glaber]|uniref:Ubiquitin-conjugating enzyme E2 G1 n=1 Tax=Heterocephalus glaber TaxID=10181 RepID=G5B3Q8_HETGA|nr:Ubiquitin-conjugating enzyme E2 G1 [Heterocephalus glaber]
MTELQSELLLRRQLAELNKNPVEGFSAGLIDDNDLYSGILKAHLTFPKDYPLCPPKMKFITEIWHPNVDKNGDVCISIFHEPGKDKYGYEKPEERWLPIHTVETIMISIILMLADPNGDSPANVDAAKEWREDRDGEFKRKVARCPPKMKFITEIWHPNVDKNGDVCISILHEPGEDKYGYEKPEERWLPTHTVKTIMISVISTLVDPNGNSPANVDAMKEWREDRNGEFKRKVFHCVRKSQETALE